MKKLMFILAALCSMVTNAQTYLISFTGEGASTTVTSVTVENLTAGTSAVLNGNQVLRLTVITATEPALTDHSSELKIYPNPMTGNSILKVYPPSAGEASVTVTDISGKQVARIQSYLDSYLQEFQLSGFPRGFFLISVQGNTYNYSGKLICNGESNGSIRIEKVSSNNRPSEIKKPDTGTKDAPEYVDMAYNTGDILKYTSISGDYSTVTTGVPTSDEIITSNFVPCTDNENTNYSIIEIGAQIWMAENLKTTLYSNGEVIGTTTPATLNISAETAPKYQWAYGGDENNADIYGRLYTWYAAADSRNICPAGWHVPDTTDWSALVTYLDGGSIAGGKMKETGTTHWTTPNTDASNESGFTALPGGFRYSDGSYMSMGQNTYIWSTTETEATKAIYRFLHTNHGIIYANSSKKVYGCSVRCIKTD